MNPQLHTKAIVPGVQTEAHAQLAGTLQYFRLMMLLAVAFSSLYLFAGWILHNELVIYQGCACVGFSLTGLPLAAERLRRGHLEQAVALCSLSLSCAMLTVTALVPAVYSGGAVFALSGVVFAMTYVAGRALALIAAANFSAIAAIAVIGLWFPRPDAAPENLTRVANLLAICAGWAQLFLLIWRQSNRQLAVIGREREAHAELAAEQNILTHLVNERSALLDTLIECMPNGVIAADLQGKILVNNPGAITISGLRTEDFPQNPQDWSQVYGLCAPDGRLLDLAEVPLGRALAGESIAHQEVLIKNDRNGQGVFVDASARPLFDAQGRHLGGVVVFTDISERKRSSDALAESEHRFRLMTDAIPQVIWTTGPDRKIEYVNRYAIEYLGRSFAEIIQSGWQGSLHPDDLPRRNERRAESLISGEPIDIEYRVRRHDGEFRWQLSRGVAELDEHGHPKHWYGVMIDIDDMKRATVALAESEQRFRLMTNAAPQIVWTAGPVGGIEYFNRHAIDYFGVPLEQLLGQGWRAALHPDDAERVTEHISQTLENGVQIEVEYRLRRHDGEYRWHLSRGVASPDEHGRAQRWYGVTTDIEDLKRARETAEQATRMKSAFLSSMSHEIRTPMNAVIGMISILLDSDLTADQRDNAEIIHSSGEHLLTIINDILDYSKIEAGAMLLESAAFSVRDCVESALDLVAGSAQQKGVELCYFAAAGVPDTVLGDVNRLRQVLANLLSNAVKFTPTGGQASIEIDSKDLGEGGYLLEFEVRDTGIGMAAEILPKLFQPFTQADASTTRQYGGTGLGLSISKHLVELMGGSIGVDSEPGKGSRFFFSVRTTLAAIQQRIDNQAPPRVLRPAQRANASFALSRELGREHSLRILVVEDTAVNRKIAELMLRRMGYQPDFAVNGIEALDAIERQIYDVVFMDVQMPVMDGLDASREICRRWPLSADRPRIIAMTANATVEDRKATELAGMNDYLSKPVIIERLIEALKRCERRAESQAI